MQVTQYLFQSPSTSQVQVGRADTSTVKSETTSSDAGIGNTNPKQAEIQAVVSSGEAPVEPVVTSDSATNVLDLYA